MSGSRDTRKLRLHRETLRSISGRALDAVAGGSGTITVSGGCNLNPAPRSNIWSGSNGTDYNNCG